MKTYTINETIFGIPFVFRTNSVCLYQHVGGVNIMEVNGYYIFESERKSAHYRRGMSGDA